MISPKHLKVAYFFSQNLFKNLSRFSELENRISNLPEGERGDAFEVFAEAYFNTQVLHQAHEVWPEKVLPHSLREKLGVTIDAGIDGIFKTHLGFYKAYQVKFRTNRIALTWDRDGLGKFFGQTDRVNERILFTNSNDLSHITETRTDFYSIKGNDLDNLTSGDFQTIDNWLKTGVVHREKKAPRPHQLEAVNNILKALKVDNRTTVIMACGTGKTLVALDVAEKINAQTILVLLPSLALIRQTLHDWAKDNSWDRFNFLCVCSDNTVVKGEEETILYQYDIDFSVTTQREVVEKFLLNEDIQCKIIFSTYQSCRIVAQAIPSTFAFDLAIFDEAHKTASRQGVNYAFGLQDQNLSIKKRLFLTATPRHYNVNKKDKEGDQQTVFSMDDQTTYGRISHQLSFRTAVLNDLICDYKVIISVVTSDMVNRELLKKGEVLIDGDVVKAQRVANILAIQNAVEKYGVKKIFSFHSSVSAAKSFTAKTNEGIGIHLKDFATLHVNGDMSTSKRDSLLTEFKKAEKAIISNARCLTEGVNVPAVDMVAFISPKKSKVDIVQAAGRAMRKNPESGKKVGYILIPLFVQVAESESLEHALEKTQFDSIWDVLQAMQEQDENLVEIIAQLREDRGKTLGINDNRLRERIEVLGPELSLDEMRRSITTNIIDRLGLTWDERLGELIHFEEEHGHCNVPKRYVENISLAWWVGTQRKLFKNKHFKLTVERINKLNQLNFEWDLKEIAWQENFSALHEFYKIHDHCNVPTHYIQNPILGRWLVAQRGLYNKNKLDLNRITKLKEIHFVFGIWDVLWKEQFDKLCDFQLNNGHCNVPKKYPDKKLTTWVVRQRANYKKGKLTALEVKSLEQIGYQWEPITSTKWDKQYMDLCKFYKKNGHCNVPKNYENNKALALWVGTQRRRYNNHKLSLDRLQKLKKINFCFDPLEQQWQDTWAMLKDFKLLNGHCNVPRFTPILRGWIKTQRASYKKYQLSNISRVNKLNELGFEW